MNYIPIMCSLPYLLYLSLFANLVATIFLKQLIYDKVNFIHFSLELQLSLILNCSMLSVHITLIFYKWDKIDFFFFFFYKLACLRIVLFPTLLKNLTICVYVLRFENVQNKNLKLKIYNFCQILVFEALFINWVHITADTVAHNCELVFAIYLFYNYSYQYLYSIYLFVTYFSKLT